MRELFGPAQTLIGTAIVPAGIIKEKKGRSSMLKFYRVFLIKYGIKKKQQCFYANTKQLWVIFM